MERELRVVPEEPGVAEEMTPQEPTQEEKGKRQRSGIQFPYEDLENVEAVVLEVHQQGGTRCDVTQLAHGLGDISANAVSRRLSAARTFGVVSVDGQRVALTNLGQRLVDPNQRAQARVSAFLKVPLYSAIYNAYRATVLPREVALEKEMLSLGVPEKQTDKARQAFLRSAEHAGMLTPTRDRLVLPPGTTAEGAEGGTTTAPPLGGGAAPIPPRTSEVPPQRGNAAKDHFFIKSLMRGLPPIGAEWPEDEREEWLESLRLGFKSLYR